MKSEKIKQLVEELSLLKKDKPHDIERIGNLAEKIINAYRLDIYHDTKRALSFEFLDMLIEECNRGFCPAYALNEDSWKVIWYCLIDISGEGYINQRAYFYSRNKIGVDDIHRFDAAKSRVDKILTCENEPMLPTYMLSYDNDELRNPQTYSRTKERKAYWSYMKHALLNNFDSIRDYMSACNFLDIFHGILNGKLNYTADNLRMLWANNLQIINGVELYKFCILRHQTATKPSPNLKTFIKA